MTIKYIAVKCAPTQTTLMKAAHLAGISLILFIGASVSTGITAQQKAPLSTSTSKSTSTKPAHTINTQKTPIITREVFLSYQDINDFIAHSPIATSIQPPNLNDIATHGPDVVTVLQGADCNRDGQVDTHKQCIKAFYQLWLRFNR